MIVRTPRRPRAALNRRATAAIVAALSAGLLATAAPVSANEDLVSYLTEGKRKVAKKVRYQFVCSADCQVTVSSTIKLKGPDVPPLVDTAQFQAGVPIAHSLTLNKSLREAITDHIGASKLVSEVRATNTATGESDTDRRTFRFKKK